MPKKHIYLSGFMGTGKSTIGRILAGKLSLPFADTDSLIEEKWGLSVSEIFERKGEMFFREEETRLLRSLSPSSPMVVSVGGGIPLKFANREILNQGIWINLKATPATILKRIGSSSNRPLLGTKPDVTIMEQLLRSREPFYSVAPVQVETDGLAPEAVAELILQRINKIVRATGRSPLRAP